MKELSQVFFILSFSLTVYALIRHFIVSTTIIYVNFKADQVLTGVGVTNKMRSAHFYTAFTATNLLNLVQTARFDNKIVASEVFVIDFRNLKPKYRIFTNNL